MSMDLLASEIRVLGCLLEKQRTTPDAYPLTLNSLRLACNQSTNRDPVVAYDEPQVRDALRRLERHGLVRFASGAGSRASKYRHMLAERMPVGEHGLAIMCVLMLRGAQTPGEIKQRTERLHRFATLPDVERTLEELIERELVARLPRQPGRKEERYIHLLAAESEEDAVEGGPERVSAAPDRLAGDREGRISGPLGGEPGGAIRDTDAQDRLEDDRESRISGPLGRENDGAIPDMDAGLGALAQRAPGSSEAMSAHGTSPEVRRELEALRARIDGLEAELAWIKRELGVEAGGGER